MIIKPTLKGPRWSHATGEEVVACCWRATLRYVTRLESPWNCYRDVNAAHVPYGCSWGRGGANYAELFEDQLTIAPMAAARAAPNPDRQLVREVLAPFLGGEQPMAGEEYSTVTNSFHGTVEELGANRVIELVCRLVGPMWHEHVVTRMDTSRLRASIHEEHRPLARAIIAGQKASRLMCEHFDRLHAEYGQHWPSPVPRADRVVVIGAAPDPQALVIRW